MRHCDVLTSRIRVCAGHDGDATVSVRGVRRYLASADENSRMRGRCFDADRVTDGSVRRGMLASAPVTRARRVSRRDASGPFADSCRFADERCQHVQLNCSAALG